MGCFGYICNGCGTSIRGDCFCGGEKCVMIHLRHGKEIGRTEGHYNEYGCVMEDNVFRNNDPSNPNSHSEICDSEFEMGRNSGIVAYHSLCYRKAVKNNRLNMSISSTDPDQSGGRIRRKFV